MYKEAIGEAALVLKALPDSNVGLTEMSYSLAVGGHQAEARTILRRLEDRSKNGFVPAYNLAILHIALNENNLAWKYLQEAHDEHDWAMFVVAVEPRLDPLRSSPGFRDLVAKLALPM